MLFNSITFCIFFPIVTGIYFLLPHKFRWLWLLIASCYFYMAFVPVYILILAFTIVVDYFAGIAIEKAEGKQKRKFLIASIIANVGVLAFFKYYNFLNENLSALLGTFSTDNPIPYLDILLPIGLSFHTFQAMSYTIEIYRGNQKSERHFGIYALYVMFYPQLVAGPIERPQNILPQLHEKKTFDYQNAVEGLRLMLWGLFKKIVIADRLAVYVNQVYDNPENFHGTPVLLAVFFFAIQIYCDFSAYSSIALGSARVMGFTLMQNFNFPFSSKSVTEFWRRWHISLSTWFNDYLYTPFVVSKRNWGMVGIVTGLFLTFFISGLWHGAAWTYVIYGCLHGIALIYEVLTKKIRKNISKKISEIVYNSISVFLTFSFVCFTLIFFRANSFIDACTIIKNSFALDFHKIGINIELGYGFIMYDKIELVISLFMVFLLFVVNRFEKKETNWSIMQKLNPAARWFVYYIFVMMIILLGNYSNTSDFIYFQF